MVRSICYTLSALILSIGFFIFSDVYLNTQFGQVQDAVQELYLKVQAKNATYQDAQVVRTLWSEKKSKLHILIPHNDISYVDYWMSELCGLVYVGEYDLALGKAEVLKEVVHALPSAYSLKLENIL